MREPDVERGGGDAGGGAVRGSVGGAGGDEEGAAAWARGGEGVGGVVLSLEGKEIRGGRGLRFAYITPFDYSFKKTFQSIFVVFRFPPLAIIFIPLSLPHFRP